MNPDKIQTSAAKASPFEPNNGRSDADRVRAVAAVYQSARGATGTAGTGIGTVSVVVADLPSTGAISSSLSPTEHRRFSIAELGAIRGWLKDRGVGIVIRVAPSSQVLIRSVNLPDTVTDRAAVAEALELIAESELPAHLPWFRRTGGVLPGPGPTGVVVGWHRPTGAAGGAHAAGDSEQLASALEGVRQIWCVEAVALGWMMRTGSPRWMAALNRDAGTAVLAIRQADPAGRLAVRSMRLAGADPERWTAGLNVAFAELAHGAGEGIVAPVLEVGPVGAPDGLIADGVAHDDVSIPTALVEAFATGDPAVRALFNLHAAEPRRSLGMLSGTVMWLSKPSRAAAVIAACVAALLLVPLGVAYARQSTLKRQMSGVTGLEERLSQAEQRVAFYSLLRERRWPMTKLLADIAGSAPEGITLDVLEINQGEPITIRGVAKSSDLVSTFRENLTKTRVFDNIATPNVGSSAEGVQFQVQARVSPTGAIYRGNLIDDFATKPLGKRMYGEAWTAESVGDDEGEESPNASTHEREAPHSSSGSSRPSSTPASTQRSGGSSSSGSSSAAPAVVPPPLSDEQISKLDVTSAMLEFSKRKNAATKPGVDAATRDRLLEESEKARQRMTELRQKGSGQ